MSATPSDLTPGRNWHRALAVAIICLSVVLVVATAFVWLARHSDDRTGVAAQQGVLDLRGLQFSKRTVPLDGEWEFYWQRLISPDEFVRQPPSVDEFVVVPNSWRSVKHQGETLPETGFATFRLRVLLSPQPKPLAIRTDYIYSAFRLWANGKLIAESGVPSQAAGDEKTEQGIQIAVLPEAQSLDLVLQTSNFHPGPSGIRTLRLGVAEDLWRWQNMRWSAIFVVSGALLLTGLYHLVLYLLRRSNVPALYFGLYCLFWVATFLCIETDWAIRLHFPEIPAELLFKIYRGSLMIASALSYQFLRSLYPQEFPRWIQNVFWVVTVAYLLLLWFAPVHVFVSALPGYYPFSAGRVLYSLWGLSLASWRRREGALVILLGYAAFGILGINDMLNDLNVIDTEYVMHFGLLVFAISQALVLATRFSKLFESVQHLSEALVDKNRLLETEIGERIRAQQDTVAVSEAERSRISHELHDGLCQALTGARLTCSTLLRKWPADKTEPTELRRLSTILDASVNHAYDLSHGLWPVEATDLDLCRALEDLAESNRQSHAISIETEFSGCCPKCSCANTTHILSIARESLVNALKHANSTQVRIHLACQNQVRATLTVLDDGIGLKASAKKSVHGGMGLRIMAYRARMVGGEFRIEPGETSGVRVTATVPCKIQE